MHLFLNFNFWLSLVMHCTFWFCFSILLTFRSTTPTKENSLPSPKNIHPSLLSSLDSCNIAFVVLQAHCRQVTHCFRNVSPWWSIILILSGDISLNPGPSARNIKACHLNVRSLRNKHQHLVILFCQMISTSLVSLRHG